MPVSSTSNGKDNSRMNGEEDSSNSDGDSSSFDEDESERRKGDCLDDIQYLEQQFSDLKELLFQEKLGEIDNKIQTVSEGNAPEYLHPQRDLQRTLSKRMETAETHLRCKLKNIDNKFEEEIQSAEQDFKELCDVTRQRLITSVKSRINRLLMTSSILQESSARKKKNKGSDGQILSSKKKKPASISGPYVVYMLRDAEILQDVVDITKGCTEFKWPVTKK